MPVDDVVLRFVTRASGFGENDFAVLAMYATEEISTPYEAELSLACRFEGGLTDEAIDDLLSARCTVYFGPHGTREMSGVLSELELLTMTEDGRSATYRVVLVPRFWLAGLTRRSRCFVGQSFPTILEQVLGEMELVSGTDFDLSHVDASSYPDNEDRQVVQYEESDFSFLSRWLERLGIFYYFGQADGVETIHFGDSRNGIPDVPEYPELRFATREGSNNNIGMLYQLRRRTRKRPALMRVRDYNWRQEARTGIVTGAADVDPNGYGMQVHYGDHFDTDTEGEELARRRSQEWMSRKKVTSARSNNHYLTAGHKFRLEQSPPLSGLDRDFLIWRVVHEAEQDGDSPGRGSYANTVLALDHDESFRPARRVAWPRIAGLVRAKIETKGATTTAPIDPRGRYRVMLPYDIYGKYGKERSAWVRKAEAYSGPNYGQHFTLHVGAEVLLAHIDGDPDRPIIVATVANDVMTNPLTDVNGTRSVIRTRSGIMFDFEDDA